MSRISEILTILKRTYPHAKIVLNYGNNWELLVSVILSAQCTDKKVNEVTAKLFPKYKKTMSNEQKTMSDEEGELENFSRIPIKTLEQDVKSTGFYRNKAKNIQAAAKIILEKFGGKLPRTMEEMLTIPGVARKTANVVLGNAYGIVEGIAVDTHVLRLSQRLRLVDSERVGPGNKPLVIPVNNVIPAKAGIYTDNLNRFRIKSGMTVDYYKDASPEKIERELMKIIPKEDWFKTTYWLIDHGRAICKAQNPDCLHCPLYKLCSASRV
ncbi:endonuclease III [Candidatus Collierbacteria bacterium]|nr:endonuclease III [Candidatus Collierbacteria bacterium]